MPSLLCYHSGSKWTMNELWSIPRRAEKISQGPEGPTERKEEVRPKRVPGRTVDAKMGARKAPCSSSLPPVAAPAGGKKSLSKRKH